MAVSLGRLEVETADHVVLRYDLAGGGNRGFAASVDFIIATFVWIGAFFLWNVIGDRIGFSQLNPYYGVAVLLTFVVAWAYFVLFEWLGNGQTIGKSEMYSSASAMESGIASVKANGPTTTVRDAT